MWVCCGLCWKDQIRILLDYSNPFCKFKNCSSSHPVKNICRRPRSVQYCLPYSADSTITASKLRTRTNAAPLNIPIHDATTREPRKDFDLTRKAALHGDTPLMSTYRQKASTIERWSQIKDVMQWLKSETGRIAQCPWHTKPERKTIGTRQSLLVVSEVSSRRYLFTRKRRSGSIMP